MSNVRILFETPDDGVHSIHRDEFHTNMKGLVTAYNNPETEGVEDKTHIPIGRVVRVDEHTDH